MNGNLGNLGGAYLSKTRNDAVESRYERAQGWMRHARGLLGALVLGLMLACGTAHASEPSSPATTATTAQTQANQAQPTRMDLGSPDLGDEFFNWSLAICIIILVAFFTIQFWDSQKKKRYK